MPYADPEKQRECYRKASQRWRERNPKYLSEYFKQNGKRLNEKAYKEGKLQARSILTAAVKKGLLPHLKRNVLKCFYCPSRAVEYDHRDYTKPLEVNPVCKSCNRRLPKAKNKLDG